MPTPVIICDDSGFARKQIVRALPAGWDVAITQAANGREAIAAIEAGRGDILFLDLTMPVMDGFAVLEHIRAHDLPTLVIVVSGDIQAESRRRVMGLGAIAFLKKPVDADELTGVLAKYGVLGILTEQVCGADGSVDFHDGCQELANVAMGRAADLLASVIDAPVRLSIPRVGPRRVDELGRTLTEAIEGGHLDLVAQGFIGGGIAGETLLLFSPSDSAGLAELLHRDGVPETAEPELLMDIANILLGAFLKGIADQLDIRLGQGQPSLHRHGSLRLALPPPDAATPREILAIELSYALGASGIRCDQLILFTEGSLDPLRQRIQLLAEPA